MECTIPYHTIPYHTIPYHTMISGPCVDIFLIILKSSESLVLIARLTRNFRPLFAHIIFATSAFSERLMQSEISSMATLGPVDSWIMASNYEQCGRLENIHTHTNIHTYTHTHTHTDAHTQTNTHTHAHTFGMQFVGGKSERVCASVLMWYIIPRITTLGACMVWYCIGSMAKVFIAICIISPAMLHRYFQEWWGINPQRQIEYTSHQIIDSTISSLNCSSFSESASTVKTNSIRTIAGYYIDIEMSAFLSRCIVSMFIA